MRHLFFLKDPSLLVEQLAEEPAGESVKLAAAPEWVNILPEPDKDGLIYSRDGRVLHIDSMEKLARRSNAALKKQKGGGPIDADHKMYGGWFTMGGGSALGWAEEFEARPGKGLWSRSEWLPEGQELIGSRQYRYTSSVVSGEVEAEVDEEAWSVTWHIFPETVDGFAITNLPALQTTSMFSADDDAANARAREELLLIVMKKLGIDAKASKDELRGAFNKRFAAREVFTSTAVEAEAPAEPLAESLSAEKKDDESDAAAEGTGEEADAPAAPAAAPPPSTPPALSGEDPVTALAKALKRIGELEADAAKSFVDGLVHSGKVTPAMRAAVLKACSTTEGLANQRDIYQVAPQIIAGSAVPVTSAPAGDAPFGLNPGAFGLAQRGGSVDELVRHLQQQQRNKENQ